MTGSTRPTPRPRSRTTTFQNDAYKTKIKTAIGAGQAPTIIWGWGGGGLKSYVEAGQVEDLTSWFGENADVKNRLFPSSFGAATVDGKIYAMPAETVQPIVLYYNKKLFDKVGVEPPQSWDDIMALVPKFNAAGDRAVLPRRPVPVDEHDVAGVPASTASAAPRCSRPSSTAEGRLVQPGRPSRP